MTVTDADPIALALKNVQSGNFDQAARACEDVLATEPNRADALKILSGVRYMEGRLDEALAILQRAAAIDGADPRVQANLGSILMRMNRPDEAIACFERAIALEPNYAEAHYNMGATLSALERFEEALASYDKVLAIMPTHSRTLINKGAALTALNRQEEAIACYDKILESDPSYAEAETNRGTALQWLNRLEEAIDHFNTAIALRPNDVFAHWNKGLAALYRGDYETGWPEYEWRWAKPDFAANKRDYTQPQWRGESDVAGKTILVFAEQGIGDTLQFCRYVPLLAEAGATVLFETYPTLKPLLKSLPGVAAVFERGETLPAFDLQCPVMSLPLAFSTRIETIPVKVPYLTPSAEKIALWRSKLGAKTKPRIGIAWSGSPTQKNDRNRSTTLERLAPLLTESRFEFHVLQKDIRDRDQATLARFPDLRVHSDDLNDFDDTAALTGEMDLVISVCTSIVHLAGAMGKPAWAMLTFSPDWRWLMDRDDCPWYPGMRLFRQTTVGDWDGLVARVRAELEKL